MTPHTPRRIALLTNPTAGRGRGHDILDRVVSRLTEHECEVDVLTGADGPETTELARKAIASGVDTVVSLGGDGTLHSAIQALAGTDVPLAVVPNGTGNDFARSLGIPTKDPMAAVDVVLRGESRRIDLARTGDRYFATVLAAGFDAAVNERANEMTRLQGNLRYTAALLSVLRSFQPLPYTLVLDGEEQQLDAMLVSVGNTDSYGGGVMMTAGAEPDDGLLDVVLIKPVSKLELIRVYPKLFKGGHVTHPQYVHHRVQKVTVAAPGIVGYADGERIGPLPLTIECVPAALSVLTPGG